MEYIKASVEMANKIYELVQDTIKTIYPMYYPAGVVEFFCELHCAEKIAGDINMGNVSALFDNNNLAGTGSYTGNHITRVYVSPEFQGKGYGSEIMKRLEDEIGLNYNEVYLDASLPACGWYEKQGYKTLKHEKWYCSNNSVLVYEIMKKKLH